MAVLNVRLGDEDERKLTQLLAVTRADRSTLVRKLINDQWVALQAGKSFVERRGGHPVNLLQSGDSNSQRDARKKGLSQHYEQRAGARSKKNK